VVVVVVVVVMVVEKGFFLKSRKFFTVMVWMEVPSLSPSGVV